VDPDRHSELRHPPEKVWQALTDPAQLREWAPFDADGNLGAAGAKVKLATYGAPSPHVTETTVTRADAPKLLVYSWGGFEMRWELEALSGGTRLTLWTSIDRRFTPWARRDGRFVSMFSAIFLTVTRLDASPAPKR
jgi:uncharacterized protein YndB with AHSA1/START domain